MADDAVSLLAELAICPSAEDPEELALMRDVTRATSEARRPSTMVRYQAPWEQFTAWCSQRKPPRCSLPAMASTVVLYLQFVANSAASYSVVKAASAAIYTAHSCALVPDELNPTKSPGAKLVRKAAQDRLGTFTRGKKEPVEVEHVVAIAVLYCPMAGFTLQSLMVGTMIAVMFAGFLRFDCAVKIFADEVRFLDTHMEMFMETRKNVKLRQGDVLVIAKGSGPACPYALTARLVAAAGMKDMHVPLFQGFDGRKDNAPLSGAAMKYSQCRQLVLKALERVLGLPRSEVTKLFGTQSLRAGGATCVAHDVPDRVFQRHGAWASAEIKNEYVKDTLEVKPAVTKAMGL